LGGKKHEFQKKMMVVSILGYDKGNGHKLGIDARGYGHES